MIERQGEKLDIAWYETELQRENGRHQLIRATLGDEEVVFATAMQAMASLLDNFFADGLIYDKPTKAKFGIAHGAYALLWSSWLDALAGRAIAAQDHWRSIHQSCDYLRAIQSAPDLGLVFFDGRLKLEAVRRTLRQARKAQGLSSDQKRWEDHRRVMDKLMTPLSHLTRESVLATIPVHADDDPTAPIWYDRSAANPSMARSICQFLASQAALLYHTCVEVFADRPAVAETTNASSLLLERIDRLENSIKSSRIEARLARMP